jgi:hypothetical protein
MKEAASSGAGVLLSAASLQGVVVLADEEPLALGGAPSSSDGFPTRGRLPLLARPVGFSMVWADEQAQRQGERRFLSIWRPVPPEGYVALGYMAGAGALPPPTAIMRWGVLPCGRALNRNVHSCHL